MQTIVRFLVLCGLATVGLATTSVSRLEAWCNTCVWGSSGGGCTACEAYWGDGYMECIATCDGYCGVRGPCAVTLDQARFSPAGQVLAYARVENRQHEGADASLGSSTASVWSTEFSKAAGELSGREGDGISLRNCAGWIITPALTAQDEDGMRVATRRMSL